MGLPMVIGRGAPSVMVLPETDRSFNGAADGDRQRVSRAQYVVGVAARASMGLPMVIGRGHQGGYKSENTVRALQWGCRW